MISDPTFVVRVLRKRKSGKPVFLGTGFQVGAKHILTSRHVVMEPRQYGTSRDIPVSELLLDWGPDSEAIHVNQLICDTSMDLALAELKSESDRDSACFLRSVMPKHELYLRAHDRFTFGYVASGRKRSLRRYKVQFDLSGFDRATGTLEDIQFHGGLPDGFSGAPILVELDGKWACVALAYLGGERAATSRLIAADPILEFLRASRLELPACVEANTLGSYRSRTDETTPLAHDSAEDSTSTCRDRRTTKQKWPPRVFVSYSHDSAVHADSVLQLSDRLRAAGIDAIIDQYELSPSEGWPRWMEKQIQCASFVLMVCTEHYRHLVMGDGVTGIGHDACWQGNLIYQHIYNAGTHNIKFIPILFEHGSYDHIPTPLQGTTHYHLETDEAYERLLNHLLGRPPANKQPPRALPRRERKHDFFAMWNVPQYNPFFTGRKEILKELRRALAKKNVVALGQPQAICGLGGVGKTQIAIQYAYLHRNQYTAVFWANAASYTSLVNDYVAIAKLLNLPEKDAKEHDAIINAVKNWLSENGGWLLIFDNADRPDVVKPFFPRHLAGHVLLTSRAQDFQTLGIARPIAIDVMSPEEAVLFLLDRTGRAAAESAERRAACDLAHELGYLPLALEQAAAFLSAKQSRFQDYLTSYRKRRLELLEREKPGRGDYPFSVATTWEMNFREVEKCSPVAAELLRLSAFLAPDSIPVELLRMASADLGPVISTALRDAKNDPVAVDEHLEPLTKYSLISRNIDAYSYTIHRLVQEITQHELSTNDQRLWAERTVRAVDTAFPTPEFLVWPVCNRLLPHAFTVFALISQWSFDFDEGGHLCSQVATYLMARSRYKEAEHLFSNALAIRGKALGPDHHSVGTVYGNLAEAYRFQGRYEEAATANEKAQEILIKTLGADNPDLITLVNNLGGIRKYQGKYDEAEALYLRSLSIREQALGRDDVDVAQSLNNLGGLYIEQGRHVEAGAMYAHALAIRRKKLGDSHPLVGQSLNNMGLAMYKLSRNAEARSFWEQALPVRERALGPEHPDVAETLANLGTLCSHEGRKEEGIALLRRALAIKEKTYGHKHPSVAINLINLSSIYRELNDYTEAESLLTRALLALEETVGAEHPHVAACLNHLGGVVDEQGKPEEAEAYFCRALAITESLLGAHHVDTADILNNLAMHYIGQGDNDRAKPLLLRALKIWQSSLQPNDFRVIHGLSSLGKLHRDVGDLGSAQTCFKRALALLENVYGPDHPEVAGGLYDLGGIYGRMGGYSRARQLLERALVIQENAFGPEHPDVAASLNELSAACYASGKFGDSEMFLTRSIAIYKVCCGPDHPFVVAGLENYAVLLHMQGRVTEARRVEKNIRQILTKNGN